MEQTAWILWIVLGVFLIIAEMFTLGFVLFGFGIGALAAGFCGWLGFGWAWQFAVFAAVSILLTAASRTIFVNYFAHGENDLKTGMDALPGRVGTVTIESRGALGEAAVKVYGSVWTAFPENGADVLAEGEKVEVVRVQGSSIYVRKVGTAQELPEWRRED